MKNFSEQIINKRDEKNQNDLSIIIDNFSIKINFINVEYAEKITFNYIKTDIEIENEIYDKNRSNKNILLNFVFVADYGILKKMILFCNDYSIVFLPKDQKFHFTDTLFIERSLLSSFTVFPNPISRLAFDDEVYDILEQAINLCISMI